MVHTVLRVSRGLLLFSKVARTFRDNAYTSESFSLSFLQFKIGLATAAVLSNSKLLSPTMQVPGPTLVRIYF